jgi:DNA-directed RNA polymerase II subunit RPB2
MVCPAETPEGAACGLVKNLSLMSHVSVGTSALTVLQVLDQFGTENLHEVNPSVFREATKVFVNGNWVGKYKNFKYYLGVNYYIKYFFRYIQVLKQCMMYYWS